MLFASTALAARIERADARLVSDSATAAARRRPGTGAFATPIGGGFATFTAPGSPLNKVAGLGFAGALDPGGLDSVERAFAERGVPVQVELSCLADPALGALLTRRGYALLNFENVLGRRLSLEPPPPPEGIAVTESPEPELAAWLDVVVTAFASSDLQGVPSHETFPRDEHERVAADMAAVEGFVRYLARREGAVAGGKGRSTSFLVVAGHVVGAVRSAVWPSPVPAGLVRQPRESGHRRQARARPTRWAPGTTARTRGGRGGPRGRDPDASSPGRESRPPTPS